MRAIQKSHFAPEEGDKVNIDTISPQCIIHKLTREPTNNSMQSSFALVFWRRQCKHYSHIAYKVLHS
jgi:hypothetical protein